MVVVAHTSAIHGVEPCPVRVEVHAAKGLPAFEVAGIAGDDARAARVRVRAALQACGWQLPPRKVTLNLAPAELRKRGAAFDLPMAVGLLASAGVAPHEALERWDFVGELSLGGEVRRVRGGLAHAIAARRRGAGIIAPAECAAEVACIAGLDARVARALPEIVAFLRGEAVLPHASDAAMGTDASRQEGQDMADVRGQGHARRAAEIAAAGAHHLLLIGPPGGGKTMIARRLAGLLPPLGDDEAVEVATIHSVAGLRDGNEPLVRHPPLRAPHPTASAAGVLGGGPWLRPGEVTLAHRGVLLLDELAEFRRDVLEALRQPLEAGAITIVRAAGCATLPARFLLAATMNPCPCGRAGDRDAVCRCAPAVARGYRGRVSGPLLDRFDLRVRVPRVRADDLLGVEAAEPSTTIRGRVKAARRLQERRCARLGIAPVPNGALPDSAIEEVARLDATARRLLASAAAQVHLSARGMARARRVARTIADLEGCEAVGAAHLAEALYYRGEESLDPDNERNESWEKSANA